MEIDTHQGAKELLDVNDLIAAYKAAVSPLLDSTSLVQLILYEVVDGLDTVLEPDELLVNRTTGHEAKSALEIKVTVNSGMIHISRVELASLSQLQLNFEMVHVNVTSGGFVTQEEERSK